MRCLGVLRGNFELVMIASLAVLVARVAFVAMASTVVGSILVYFYCCWESFSLHLKTNKHNCHVGGVRIVHRYIAMA